MPRTGADPLLLDTSAAVALVMRNHESHESTFASLHAQPLGLCGHAAFEVFSVLTRLPAPDRLSAASAGLVLRDNFPHTRHLSPGGAAALLARLPALGLAGGSVYDALVAATAAEHALTLVSRDRRALATYQAIGATVQLLA